MSFWASSTAVANIRLDLSPSNACSSQLLPRQTIYADGLLINQQPKPRESRKASVARCKPAGSDPAPEVLAKDSFPATHR